LGEFDLELISAHALFAKRRMGSPLFSSEISSRGHMANKALAVDLFASPFFG
jgi:hypothetical protein